MEPITKRYNIFIKNGNKIHLITDTESLKLLPPCGFSEEVYDKVVAFVLDSKNLRLDLTGHKDKINEMEESIQREYNLKLVER